MFYVVDYGLLILGGTYFGRGRKGSRLIFRPKDGDFSGNACEVEDVRRNPGTSYLFVLTAYSGCVLHASCSILWLVSQGRVIICMESSLE